MSESQPLLTHGPEDRRSTTWKQKAAQLLESSSLHKSVITLIAVDACCVIAELVYTLLSQDCSPGGPENPAWLELLSHISLVITALFLVEIPFASWAFGLRYYNPFGGAPFASLHALDALIIVTTFTLEAILRGKERELAGLLIVFRLWRLVKLVGGVAVGAGELSEEEAKELAEVREKLEEARVTLRATHDENQALRRQIAILEESDSHV